MRTLLTVIAVTIGALGLVAFGVGWNSDNDEIAGDGAALVVAALAALGAAAGLETWRGERLRAREVKQREAYAGLMQQLYSRFDISHDRDAERRLRAEVVTWGSPEVIKALSEWNAAFDEVAVGKTSDANQQFELTEADQGKMTDALAKVVSAIRKELTVESGASEQDIHGALFNKPQGG